MFDRKEKKEGRSRKGAQNKEQRIGKFELPYLHVVDLFYNITPWMAGMHGHAAVRSAEEKDFGS
jgi:hypothetical protein